MTINKKGVFVMASALLFSVLCTGCDFDSTQEVTDQQRWENAVDEYVRVVNEKNFVYDRTNILDLGMKSYDHGRKYTCPLNSRKTCKIRKSGDGNSVTVYIPEESDTFMPMGDTMMYIPGDDAIDLLTYYKDADGHLRVRVESYDW